MLRVGINGFGRIGRSMLRISQQKNLFDVVAINDIDSNVENHAYLLRYDSHYGRFDGKVIANNDEMEMTVNGEKIKFFSGSDVSEVKWENADVDVVIDATGVHQNVISSRALVDSGRVKKVVITHAPKEGVDATIVFGVNEMDYDSSEHHVVSSSICDVISSAVVLNILEKEYGIRSGFATTLHPWLSYQNVLDGTVQSISSPGHLWEDFTLGRSSSVSLIPKKTTLTGALSSVLPEISDRIHAMSFRIPTGTVTTADVVLELEKETDAQSVFNLLKKQSEKMPSIMGFSDEPLVSIDYLGINESLIVDGRWIEIANGRNLRLVYWYDNEWGYSNRVVDLAVLIGGELG